MNSLRLSLATGALTLVLSLSAFAGEIHTTVTSPLPPATGEMHTPVVEEFALSLAQIILALF